MIWAVVQAVRNREVEAKSEVLRRGLGVFLPMMPVLKQRMRQKAETVLVPRFSPFLFANFDPDVDDWESLNCTGPVQTRPIFKVWCNAYGRPRPVPERAIKAMQAYDPPAPKPDEPIVYTEGQAVNVYLAPGRAQPGVFIGYDRGKMLVEVWILGREMTIPVPESALEPSEALTREAV